MPAPLHNCGDLTERRITAEQFIATETGQHHLEPLLRGGTADQISVESINGRLIHACKKVINYFLKFIAPDANGDVTAFEDLCRSFGKWSLIVSRTKGASAAFIKELMRRSAQFQMEAGESTALDSASVDAALEEMLFTGGALNAKLLGGIID